MCKNNENSQSTSSDTNALEQENKTYAEISIATGGEWKDRKYENRDSFINVTDLKVPQQHTDHSYFIRYEGPGWESNLVGYRLYLDWRNAIDIFGKKTENMVLDQVGQDGFDSYHEMSDWGLDILKVGKALGLGSYGRLINDSVYHFQVLDSTDVTVSNEVEESKVKINYYGWAAGDNTSDLTATFSIQPNSRLTKVNLSNYIQAEGLVTGIVIHDETEVLKSNTEKEWAYLATYGKQTLVPDNLGMVIFYKTNQVDNTKAGKYDHLIEFSKENETIEYYFGAAWEGETNGIKTKEEFQEYINQKLNELNI